MSNTEPLLRLNVEARTAEAVDEIVGQVSRLVGTQNPSESKAAT
jgi:phosphomannomutase